MAKNFEHIIHKNSSALVDDNPKLPTSGQLEYGEIAVNYAKDKETISLKNSNNEIVTFTSDKKLDNYVTVSDFEEAMQVASAALNDLEATKLEKSVFDEALENLYTKEEADDDSLVVASALNDLEEKKLDKLDFDEMLESLETQLSDFYTKEEIDNAELVTTSALNDLDGRIGDIENAFKELDEYFDENELIISSALNDLEEKKADKGDLTDLVNNVYTKEEIDDDHLVISTSLNDLNTRLLSASNNIDSIQTSIDEIYNGLDEISDTLGTKQEVLVSGTNIKTINNESILGSGNITIQGSGSGDVNIIESVKVNGTALTPDANKAVDITSIPASIVTQDATHRFASDSEKTTWNSKSDFSGSYNDLTNKPTIPAAVTESTVSGWGFTKNTGTVTGVKINGTTNNPTNGVVDLGTVITSHQDISGKADKSAAIGSLSLSMDSTNYKITLSGTKVDGTTFTVSDVIDLPLESVVVNGSYNNTTKKVVLTLQNGSTVEFSVADLISGLQSEITSTNKLSADLIADGTTNKVVTASEKSTWNGKQDALSNANVLSGITSTKVSNWDSAATNSHTHSNKSVLDGIKATDITNWNSKTDNVGTVTGVKMNGTTNNPTNGVVDLGTVITSETSLSKGTATGTGNAVTDITVSGHRITLTKGTTFLTEHQDISGKANSADLATVATSGSYNDLTDKPTIPDAQVQSDWNATTGMGVILNKPTIPSAPGTLKTNNTAAQTASASESLSGTINLHKVAKTGTYSDLIGTPTIPSAPGTLTTTATTAQSTATNESLSGNIALHKVSKTGSYNDLNNKPTIPTVNNATITIKNGSTTLGTFTVNASSNVEIDISSALPIGVPSYTSADNGKILGVVNGALAWITPTTIYTGSGTPSSSTGNDGDIYLQTS